MCMSGENAPKNADLCAHTCMFLGWQFVPSLCVCEGGGWLRSVDSCHRFSVERTTHPPLSTAGLLGSGRFVPSSIESRAMNLLSNAFPIEDFMWDRRKDGPTIPRLQTVSGIPASQQPSPLDPSVGDANSSQHPLHNGGTLLSRHPTEGSRVVHNVMTDAFSMRGSGRDPSTRSRLSREQVNSFAFSLPVSCLSQKVVSSPIVPLHSYSCALAMWTGVMLFIFFLRVGSQVSVAETSRLAVSDHAAAGRGGGSRKVRTEPLFFVGSVVRAP